MTNECIVFSGHKDSYGYGILHIKNLRYKAHAVAFKLRNPSVRIDKKNIGILHKCDNRACINAEHLFKGTFA